MKNQAVAADARMKSMRRLDNDAHIGALLEKKSKLLRQVVANGISSQSVAR
jgi:hypothetical protein